MSDQAALEDALAQYKQDFIGKTWPVERYKWKAVKVFQDNWDPDAADFPEMLTRSLSKTENLLASQGSYPRATIEKFAKTDPERVRSMFVALFDESGDLFERIDAFKRESAGLLEDKDRSHYQTENAITTYLWLRYPDRYYIYKWSEAREVAKVLGTGHRFKMGDYTNNVRDHLDLYDAICERLQADPDLRSLLDSQLTEEEYADPELRTMTIDVGFYISRGLGIANESPDVSDPKAPHVARDPQLTADEWERLLSDRNIFTSDSLKILKRIKHAGGSFSYAGLADEYGQTERFYEAGAAALAKRVAKAMNLPVRIGFEDEETWESTLFLLEPSTESAAGSPVWELRSELSNALDQVDLGPVPLHEEAPPEERNYWWLVASPKQIFRFDSLSVGGVEGWTLRSPSGAARQIPQNFLDAKEGDLVIGYESTPVKKIVALGEISEAQDGEHLWFKKNEALVTPVDYADVLELPQLASAQMFSTNMRGSLFKLTEEEYGSILDLVREANPEPEPTLKEQFDSEDFLSEVFMSEEDYKRMVSVLRRKKNLILQGAPGVGKTFAANRLAWSMMGVKDDARVETVQFHQNYSYEDFVMGYKPTDDGFKLRMGVFHEFCRKASNHPDEEFFFIIDEINRGNLSKIFGELLMLIEKDYRGKGIALAYDSSHFSVPDNVHIIGMMNTADRSLAMIDYALRRRFSFVTMKPGFQTEGFKTYQEELGSEPFDRLIAKIEELNAEIAKDPSLGEGFQIGHSYFCNQDRVDNDWLESVVDYEVMPMLEEYWFDEPKAVGRWREELHKAIES